MIDTLPESKWNTSSESMAPAGWPSVAKKSSGSSMGYAGLEPEFWEKPEGKWFLLDGLFSPAI